MQAPQNTTHGFSLQDIPGVWGNVLPNLQDDRAKGLKDPQTIYMASSQLQPIQGQLPNKAMTAGHHACVNYQPQKYGCLQIVPSSSHDQQHPTQHPG